MHTSPNTVPADRSLPDLPPPALAGERSLSVAIGARDHTLGRPGRHRTTDRLFWLLVLAPAVLAAIVAGPWIGLAMLPLQMLAAILVGTAVARSRQCGAMTLASLPLTALAMLWVAASF